METLDDFGEYYRDFCKVWYFLSSQNRVTEREASNLFLSGFTPSFKTKLKAQLKLQNPRHHEDDPLSISELYGMAIFVLSCHLSSDITTAAANEELTDVAQIFQGDVCQDPTSLDLPA